MEHRPTSTRTRIRRPMGQDRGARRCQEHQGAPCVRCRSLDTPSQSSSGELGWEQDASVMAYNPCNGIQAH